MKIYLEYFPNEDFEGEVGQMKADDLKTDKGL